MAEARLGLFRYFLRIGILTAFLMLCIVSCSTSTKIDIKREVQIPKEARKTPVELGVPPQPLRTPDFVTAREEISPLKTKITNLSVRNQPLRDVLYYIASGTGLNLVMDKDVDPEVPITLNLENVSAEDALSTVFSSVDYLYTVKNNMLFVKATETRVYEIGYPAVVQSYNTDVGGDILGGAISSTGASGSLKGTISQKSESDKTAYNFWDVIEKSLEKIISSPAAASGTAPTPTSTASPSVSTPNITPAAILSGLTGGTAAQGAATSATMTKGTQSAPSPTAQPTQTAAAAKITAIPVQTAAASGAFSGPQQSFTINRLTGTIFVTATKKNLERVEQYLGAIKSVINKQVLIEAKIIEVQLSDSFKFGIDWSLVLSNAGLSTTAAIATNNFASVVDQAGSFLSFVMPSPAGEARNWNSTLNAIQQQGEVRVLSNPRISIMNGQTALLTVGTNRSYIAKMETTTVAGPPAVTTYTVSEGSVLSGLMIGIVPFVNENGEISLSIVPITSDLTKLETTTFGTGGELKLQLPTIDLRQLSTTVKARSGQTVVIGGLIQKKEQLQESFIPFLGKIPYLGVLFSSISKVELNLELVILLQPVLVSR